MSGHQDPSETTPDRSPRSDRETLRDKVAAAAQTSWSSVHQDSAWASRTSAVTELGLLLDPACLMVDPAAFCQCRFRGDRDKGEFNLFTKLVRHQRSLLQQLLDGGLAERYAALLLESFLAPAGDVKDSTPQEGTRSTDLQLAVCQVCVLVTGVILLLCV